MSSYKRIHIYGHVSAQPQAIANLFDAQLASEIIAESDLAIFAINPAAGIDQKTIDREIEVGKDLAIQEGKPVEMAEKIAMGRLNKFFQENTLLSQPFVRDNKLSVEQFLNSTEKGLTVTEFKRFSLS